jgi:hypothetical protein
MDGVSSSNASPSISFDDPPSPEPTRDPVPGTEPVRHTHRPKPKTARSGTPKGPAVAHHEDPTVAPDLQSGVTEEMLQLEALQLGHLGPHAPTPNKLHNHPKTVQPIKHGPTATTRQRIPKSSIERRSARPKSDQDRESTHVEGDGSDLTVPLYFRSGNVAKPTMHRPEGASGVNVS